MGDSYPTQAPVLLPTQQERGCFLSSNIAEIYALFGDRSRRQNKHLETRTDETSADL
jgi:hypothetical protein